eukprot:4185848-Amphidinium_carterae.1
MSLWIEDGRGAMVPPFGCSAPLGKLIATQGVCVSFNPHMLHAAEDWQRLAELGFPTIPAAGRFFYFSRASETSDEKGTEEYAPNSRVIARDYLHCVRNVLESARRPKL